MSRLYLLLIFLVITASISGCYYDKEDELYEYYYNANQCKTDSLTYTADIEPVVRGHCATTGCHVAGGAGPGIFESYAGVKEKVDDGSFMQRVVVDRDMPPYGPLSNCQISQIEAWIVAGAPEN